MAGLDFRWPYTVFRKRLVGALSLREDGGLLLAGGPNITYVTGAREPSGALLISERCGDILVTSILDYHRMLTQAPRDVNIYAIGRPGEEGIKPQGIPTLRGPTLGDALASLASECGLSKIHVDFAWLQEPVARALRDKLSKSSEVLDVSSEISRVRSTKDPFELDLIEKAIDLAERALSKVLVELDPDVSEAKAAGSIYGYILEHGGWGPSFPPIVAFHENTAYPHHTPSHRRLGAGGPVLIDLGAITSGYMSDMTRTTFIGSRAPKRFRDIIESVIEAQEEAIDSIAPGVSGGDVDKTARSVLERRGLAPFFIHGLGHGVGVEIHEKPYLRPGSKEVLEPGMVVTVEPGVYIPGLYGVRVEDMVLVTKTGRRVLTRFSKLLF